MDASLRCQRDRIHLTRICSGCGDSGGARHVVKDVATVDDIVAYEMYTNELRSIDDPDLTGIIAKRDADAFRTVG